MENVLDIGQNFATSVLFIAAIYNLSLKRSTVKKQGLGEVKGIGDKLVQLF
jgi:hypothetical protein